MLWYHLKEDSCRTPVPFWDTRREIFPEGRVIRGHPLFHISLWCGKWPDMKLYTDTWPGQFLGCLVRDFKRTQLENWWQKGKDCTGGIWIDLSEWMENSCIPVCAHQRVALAEKDFIDEVYKWWTVLWIPVSFFHKSSLSSPNKIMKKVAIMAGMEVRLGFSSVDFHLPRLNWSEAATQLASSRRPTLSPQHGIILMGRQR